MRHQYNENDSKTKLALESENLVYKLFKKEGYKVEKTSYIDNYANHTDLFVYGDKKRYSVDVKRKRSDFICCEMSLGYKSFDTGKLVWRDGWLYSQSLNFLAFHIFDKNEIVIVKRKVLADLVDANIDNFDHYRRSEFKEKLIIVPYEEIINIAVKRIYL